ncbi:bifunctional 3'-5' exonuclease/DNA polymerase [Ornithinimicrobium pekingense]|uniref:DNA-directed DNA polymerase n=1 Tax=Ornithinimicrobium pekingense TaxID=384677 RepID=A0ABQ2F8R8_9MICO|nr:bifunctional 3'-5' exonuclease/DNA polymerase [Ornithinimicrobium pekingense]GGK72923.1 bifunctional 3'-5' exonuclease/DNA polymerase [Ornithinimicrobium pekingense]
MDLVIAAAGEAVEVVAVEQGAPGQRTRVLLADLPAWVAAQPVSTRWVWADSAALYPTLLRAGVRVRRAVDLRLVRTLLRRADAVRHTDYARAVPSSWDAPPPGPDVAGHPDQGERLFDLTVHRFGIDECVVEHLAQQRCLAQTDDDGRLALLCHAESVGGLVAQELNSAGVPFSVEVHDAQLTELLGTRDSYGGRPAVMAQLCGEVQAALGAPRLNPDSPVDLVGALRRAGLDVSSTRQGELEQLDHPVIEPLLRYKKLSRLHTANGWAWSQAWVRDGRFRPDWVAGAVVTGRWASRGGGALQLPRQIRAAVRADPGWRLVVADAAQLEPRVLAAMSGDRRMAAAAAGADLYQALVDQGVVPSRQHAKIAMLGAMYGATTGEAGALMPQLQRAYPRAIDLVESAARAGERGERVRTWLGRTSPLPPSSWREAQDAAQRPGSGPGAEKRARQVARDWGRFTRNFVVQGTAAEWALCWMGHLRRLLDDEPMAGAHPELVYFLHDEVIVHAPAAVADAVADAVREAARAAGQLLFGTFPVEFPLSVAVVDSYDQAR